MKTILFLLTLMISFFTVNNDLLRLFNNNKICQNIIQIIK